MATSKISESCVFICLLGLTSVTYGYISNSECKSPLGMEDGRIKDSQITVTGFTSKAYGWQARLHKNIPKWGAWCADVSGESSTERNYDQYILIDLLNLTKITLIATQGRQYNGGREWAKDYKLSYRKDGGVWHFYQRKDQAEKIFRGNAEVFNVVSHDLHPAIMARYIRVHPGYHQGNNACMRLELYGCEVNKKVSGGEGLSTTQSTRTTPSQCKTCTTKPETTNSTAMFVGIAVTLAIVLIVLFVILIIYKRRRQASKSVSTAVDTVGIENQAANAETGSSPNNQGLDRVSPANGRTAPYEEIQIISPPSVYEILNRNRPFGRETTNSDRSSGYVFPDNGSQIAPYEEVQFISPPSVYEMLNRNRPVGRETTNSDCSSGYVIPDNGRIAPYKVVQIVSPPSVNDEPIRNGPDGRRATAYSDCSSGYEEVQISSLSGYTELDNTKREQKDDAHYQKLIKK